MTEILLKQHEHSSTWRFDGNRESTPAYRCLTFPDKEMIREKVLKISWFQKTRLSQYICLLARLYGYTHTNVCMYMYITCMSCKLHTELFGIWYDASRQRNYWRKNTENNKVSENETLSVYLLTRRCFLQGNLLPSLSFYSYFMSIFSIFNENVFI